MIRSNPRTLPLTVLIALLAAGLGACVDKDAGAPAAASAATQAPVASIDKVQLGAAVGADGRITAATGRFAANDTVHVAIAVAVSDGRTAVAGKVGTRLIALKDGAETVLRDETRDLNLANGDTVNFQFAQIDGFPPGKYRVEVALDGKPVQNRDFEVVD